MPDENPNNGELAAPDTPGVGGLTYLTDLNRVRGAMRDAIRAVQDGWDIDPEVAKALPVDAAILASGAEDERVRLGAMRLLKEMKDANWAKAKEILDRIAPKPQATPAVTVNVQQGIAIKLEE